MERPKIGTRIILMVAFMILWIAPATAEDWIHPARRNQFPGYQKLEDRKQNSPDWRYATNRPLGNIHGGGTVEYQAYIPMSRVPSQVKAATYRRPFRKGADRANACNCPITSFSSGGVP